MPKCITCDKVLAPDLMVDVSDSGECDIVPMRCIFCEQNITEFGGNTKEEHIKEYDIFLKKLKESKNIAEIVSGKEKPLIV